MTQEDEVTFNSTISPAQDQFETAASEKIDRAVAPGQSSRAGSKEYSHCVNDWSQQQQKQKSTSPRNKFTYEIGTLVVLRIDKEVSDSKEPSLWIAKLLDVSKRRGDSLIWRLMVHWFDTIEDPGKEKELLLEK